MRIDYFRFSCLSPAGLFRANLWGKCPIAATVITRAEYTWALAIPSRKTIS